ncbi:glycosyltransferase [Halomonas sp. HK25]|uniref:glycosyltransferase n=1 Tax=Halomonas sp. HK25 TaxID=3394321 RepID=UPI0039FD8424
MSSNFEDGQGLTVACIIPTYNGRDDLKRLLDSIDQQSVPLDLFIVDSSSTDGTGGLARSRVKNVITIPGSEFNHGGTRQMMVELNPGYDVYVFLTQDAYLEDVHAIENLVAPFSDECVGAVCGRQLPHIDANPLAEHARQFNYPAESKVKSLADAPMLGIKTPFISNSFSAYRREALLRVGGFPKHVILSEDMYVAARMLLTGWKVAYAGNAQCRHSHNYTLKEEFLRYFDQGVFHVREAWIRQHFGGAGGEGFRYVKSELNYLGLSRFYMWPSAIVRNASKLLAYKLGQQEYRLSINLKKNLSMHKRYWDSDFSERK